MLLFKHLHFLRGWPTFISDPRLAGERGLETTPANVSQGRGGGDRPRDNLRRLIPSALRFVVLFFSVLCCLGIFSCTLCVACLSGIHLEDAKTVFSSLINSPLRLGKRHALFPSTTPQGIVFCRTLETHLPTNRSFVSFYFLATVLLAVFFAWLLGTSERIHLCFFFLWNSGNTLLTQTGNRRGKAAEEYGRKKRGRQRRRYTDTDTTGWRDPFFRLFAAVQDHHTSLARDKLTYFLC